MPVPLFDPTSPQAPLRADIRAAVASCPRRRAVHPRAGGQGVRDASSRPTSAPATRSAWPTAPTRSLLALRALGRRPGRRGHRPVVHVLRLGRGDPADRRARPSSATSTPTTFVHHRRDGASAVLTPKTKAVIAVHLFGNVAPIAEIEALGVPVLEDAAQAAGTVLADGRRPGALGHDRHLLVLPVQEPRRLRRRRRDHDERRRAGRDASGRCASTAPRTSGPSTMIGHNCRLDELQAGDPARPAPAPRRLGRRPPRRGRPLRRGGLGELVTLPVPTAGARPAWHLYVVRHDARRRRCSPRSRTPASARAAYYRVPVHLQPAMREYAPTLDLPGTDEAARTQPRDPDEPGR